MKSGFIVFNYERKSSNVVIGKSHLAKLPQYPADIAIYFLRFVEEFEARQQIG